MMSRRLLGPIGGPIAFFLVAGLVFAGLGWVTIAALRVEDAQREAARRADREKELRIALWRLDARMLPALGVEDTRPFHEFRTYSSDDPITVYGPACAPLLAADLPEWMQLHFQLDPDAGWESPQVLTRGTRVSLRRHWPELPLRNADKPREELLASLNAKFPAKLASEAFNGRARALPLISPVTPPLSLNGGGLDDASVPMGEPKTPTLETPPKPTPVSVPVPPAKAIPGAEARIVEKADALAAAPANAGRKATEYRQESKAIPPSAPESGPANAVENQSKAEIKNTAQNNRLDYDERQLLLDKAVGDAARFKYQLPGSLSGGFAANKSNATASKDSTLAMRPGGIADRSGIRDENAATDGAGKRKLAERSSGGFALNIPASEFKKVETDPLGFYRLIEEAKSRERERKQADNLHRGGLPADSAKKDAYKEAPARGLMAKNGIAVPPAPGAAPPGPPALGVSGPASASKPGEPKPTFPAPPAGPPPPGFGRGAGGGAGPPGDRVPLPLPPTPDPAPPVELQPVDGVPAPPFLPPAADEPPAAPPVAVHLGSLRPQWLTAADGTSHLVLVRAARVENKKTVYQGVVLDWAKLQAVLQDEVKDLFPEAKLEPVKNSDAASREQSMTALPVDLEPGPEPTLPPAGWTPLRIGLVLAWVAAAIAFAAVGLSGWSLIDLAERRIRFVSAVTHELRTPLTSLRLYLDLLLSGMVQDEEKRREYLSTLNVESDRLHRLIDNVLDFAKLERRRKGRELQSLKAVDLLESIRVTWTDRVAADGKELVVISTLLPEQDVNTDASLVQQIVGNLIDNARKYTRDATDARIWLWARVESGSKLVFEVEDRGTGVPPREQKLIFRPFRRGDTADSKAGGAGLGLALSKEWAEVLGGRLIYRTPEGGTGSAFRLELPLK